MNVKVFHLSLPLVVGLPSVAGNDERIARALEELSPVLPAEDGTVSRIDKPHWETPSVAGQRCTLQRCEEETYSRSPVERVHLPLQVKHPVADLLRVLLERTAGEFVGVRVSSNLNKPDTTLKLESGRNVVLSYTCVWFQLYPFALRWSLPWPYSAAVLCFET